MRLTPRCKDAENFSAYHQPILTPSRTNTSGSNYNLSQEIVFPTHGVTGEAVIQAADNALYRAKKEGRDRVITAS